MSEEILELTDDQKKEKALNIIRYYNKLYNKAIRVGDTNVQLILDKIDVTSKDKLVQLRLFIDRNKQHSNEWDFEMLLNKFEEEVYLKKVEKEEELKNANSEAQANLSVLEQALAKVFMESKADVIEQEFVNKCVEIAKEKIKEEYGTIEKKVDVKFADDKVVTFEGEILHNKFEEVLKFVSKNEPVFLTGEAGTGKNVLCKQIAKALGLKFYFSNAVTQEYKLTGFTDAMGNYQETQFYKAFKYGGLFMLDEMDASIPEVLVILNSAIANKYFDFPAPIGYVEAHPDFRIVGAGNTYGEGASYQYVGRNQLDGASLDRFACVNIDYDIEIEKALCQCDEELVEFIHSIRSICKKHNIQLIASYRAINRIYKLQDEIELTELLKSCLFKNLTGKEMNIIIDNYSKGDKYYNAMKNIRDAIKEKEEQYS